MQNSKIIKIGLVVVALLIMVAIAVPSILSYLDSPYPYVLGVREGEENSELYLINWQENGEPPLLITDSEGEGVLPVLWATADSQTFEQSLVGGIWAGGNAYLLPEKEMLLYATQHGDAWDMSAQYLGEEPQTVSLFTGIEDIHMVSIAPDADLLAVSSNPITPANKSSVEIISMADGSKLSTSVTDVFHAQGILSPNGEHLLSSVTITDTIVYTSTGATITDTVYTTQTVYNTTYHLTTIQNDSQKLISEFTQDEDDFFNTVAQQEHFFKFTTDSEAFIFEIPGREIRLQGIGGEDAALLYTGGPNSTALLWRISPDNRHIMIIDEQENANASMYIVSLNTGEKTSVAEGDIKLASFIAPQQLMYVDKGYTIYDIDAQKDIIQMDTRQLLAVNEDNSRLLYVVPTGDTGTKFNITDLNFLRAQRLANTKSEELWLKASFLQSDLDNDSQIITGTVYSEAFNTSYILFSTKDSLFSRRIWGNISPVLLNNLGTRYDAVTLVSDAGVVYTSVNKDKKDIYFNTLNGDTRTLLLENARLLR